MDMGLCMDSRMVRYMHGMPVCDSAQCLDFVENKGSFLITHFPLHIIVFFYCSVLFIVLYIVMACTHCASGTVMSICKVGKRRQAWQVD